VASFVSPHGEIRLLKKEREVGINKEMGKLTKKGKQEKRRTQDANRQCFLSCCKLSRSLRPIEI